MVKADLFESPVSKFLFDKFHTFPVARNRSDSRAYKTSLKILNEGHILCIFPEGTRKNRDFKAEPGIGHIALKANVPILPAAIKIHNKVKGFEKNISFLACAKVRFGKPMYYKKDENLSEKESLVKYVNDVMNEVKRLYDSM